jgi:hypothetical protein
LIQGKPTNSWRFAVLLLAMILTLAVPGFAMGAETSDKPAIADAWLDLATTYCIHAKTIWHDAAAGDVGGYWGDGVVKDNGNGNVRGTVNTMMGYAMLIHAVDNGWLKQSELDSLKQAGLSRTEMLRYIQLNLVYLIAHHSSTPNAHQPAWGFSWQSTMWMGAVGPAMVLTWKDLPEDIKRDFKRIAAVEADRIVTMPSKDYLPGDTGAEENAWYEHGPAVALMIDPTNPHAADWMKALKRYAVNVYSTKADKTSDQLIGTDKSRDIVSTSNIFDDFTLENHGFFHPDYSQVSAEHLGESLLFLQMGDRLNHTKLAAGFQPYAMHHLADVWSNVLRPLLMNDGEFTFPNSTDWTVNCSMTPSCLACISTLLHDPIATAAESKLVLQAERRRAVSPSGRILGDTNLEWWWEPLLIDRSCTAMLQHEYRDSHSFGKNMPTEVGTPSRKAEARYWPIAKSWVFHNENYFVSASWGARHMATFMPMFPTEDIAGTYLTMPIVGILPAQVESLIQEQNTPNDRTLLIQSHDGSKAAIICLPHSVLWVSQSEFAPLGIENDKLSGGQRNISDANGVQTVQTLSGKSIEPHGWVDIEDRLGLIDETGTFKYTAASTFNHRSYACDQIQPDAKDHVWWMLPGMKHDQMNQLAAKFKVTEQNGAMQIDLHDEPNGNAYKLTADFAANPPHIQVEPQSDKE